MGDTYLSDSGIDDLDHVAFHASVAIIAGEVKGRSNATVSKWQ
jgi:hypothetical protein